MADLRSAEGWKVYLDQFAKHRAKLSEKEDHPLLIPLEPNDVFN
jgi:hypothetical protein